MKEIENEMLVGKIPIEIHINDDKTQLALIMKDGEVIIGATEGDCCSETWIEHLSFYEGDLGKPIKEVEEVEMGDVDLMGTRQDVDQLYCTKIHLEGYSSVIGIEYRNSSNGYYGGDLSFFVHSGKLVGFTKLRDSF